MKSRKVIPFPWKKKNPKTPEYKVFEFSSILEEYIQRESSRRDDGKEEDRSGKDDV